MAKFRRVRDVSPLRNPPWCHPGTNVFPARQAWLTPFPPQTIEIFERFAEDAIERFVRHEVYNR